MYIDSFERLGPDRCVIGGKELRIRRVAACRLFVAYTPWDFLYIETSPDEPTGLYKESPDFIAEKLREKREKYASFGAYVDEEYAVWNDIPITAGEFEDRAAIIDGKLVRISGAKRRTRFLTSYNMIIAGNRHVINENDLDDTVSFFLDDILSGQRTLEELARYVQQLPKPRRFLDDDY
jgi:hypothetical protein